MSSERDKLYDLCAESQRRVGSLLLTLLLLSTLYWLSFFLFVDDPRRTLIGPSRQFVARIDELEQDHVAWQTLRQANIARLIVLGDRYLEGLQRLPAGHPARTKRIDLDVQARLPDRLLTDYLSRTNARTYVEMFDRWLTELKSLSINKIIYTSEVLDLYVPYETLNLPPGWLSQTGKALEIEDLGPVPAEIDSLPWQDLRGRLNVLFASLPEFEAIVQQLQTLWQGEITDEMQTRALHGSGVWLRNLESGRSIAQGFLRKEPSIRLPFLGENISGRWAFYLGPLVFLILLRYLRRLAQHIRVLEDELRIVRLEENSGIVMGEDDTLTRLARYPNLIEVLRLQPGRTGRTRRSTMDIAIVAAVLVLPASTLLPVGWVDWTISGPTARVWVMLLMVAMYSAVLLDTAALLAYYAGRTAKADEGGVSGPPDQPAVVTPTRPD